MAARRGSKIDGKAFASRKEATVYVRELRDRWMFNKRITGADHNFLVALLDRHEDAIEKIGVGIDHFEVRAAPRVAGRQLTWCFWVFRPDGTREPFSFTHCLKV